MSDFLLFLVAIYGFLFVSAKVSALRLILGLTYRPVSGELVGRADIPSGLLTQYQLAAEELYQVGFELSHFERRPDFSPDIAVFQWVMVLQHPVHRSFAEISVPSQPDISRPVNIFYLTFFDSVDLISRHLSMSAFEDDNEDVLFNSYLALAPADQWESHLAFLADATSAGAVTGEGQFPDPSNYLVRHKGSYWRYLAALENQGTVTEEGSAYRIRFKSGLSSLLSMQKRMNTATKNLVPVDGEEKISEQERPTDGFAAIEADAYKRNEQFQINSRFDIRTKAILSLLSFSAFAILFGFIFSWGYLLALVPVLVFHELGHLAAMRLFGYKDLQLLFMPLGAVALGRESENHKPWQEAVVLLAGPVPGIVLASIAWFVWPDPPHWAEILIYVSLILNYFNLLPIIPLDGGQLMQLALFKRSHVAKLIFKTISALVFALGAWFGSDPILLLLAIVVGYLCFLEVKDWLIVRKHKITFNALTDFEDKVERAFTALSERKDAFAKKSLLVTQLVGFGDNHVPRLSTSATIVVVYLALMVGPLVAAYGYFYTGYAFDFDEAVYEADYWDEKIANEKNQDRKIELMIEAGNWLRADEQDTGKEYLSSAATMALSQGNTQLYSEAMYTLVSQEYYDDDSSEAINHYWTWLDGSQVIDDNVVEATRLLSDIESTELAYPFAARRLSLAVSQSDAFNELDAYIELAFRHIDQQQKSYAQHFMEMAQQVELDDQNHTHYSLSRLADINLTLGQLEQAVAILEEVYFRETQDESNFDSAMAAIDLGWLALHQNQLKRAKDYFNKADAHMSNFHHVRDESIGTLGRMMLGSDGMQTLNEDTHWQWEYRMVMASYLDDPESYEHARTQLTEYSDERETMMTYYREATSTDTRFSVETIKNRLILNLLETTGQ